MLLFGPSVDQWLGVMVFRTGMAHTAAIAIPAKGYFEVERGRYGPTHPRTTVCHGLSIIAKVKEGCEEAVRADGKEIEETIAASPEVLAPPKLHYLRWNLEDCW